MGEFHCRASRRRATYFNLTALGREISQPRAASTLQSSGNLETNPDCWAGFVIAKYGEKTFKVRFVDVHIAAARAPRMAPKQV
jgi:hypothetical protein